jgi:hypothetical protein
VLDDKTYIAIAHDYMQGMGYGEQPYAVFLHTDKAHLHLHVVSSRVSAKDFRKKDDYNERWRSQCVGAIIERKYGITDVLSEKLPMPLKRVVDGFFEQQAQSGVTIEAYFKRWREMLNVRTLKAEVRQRTAMSEVSNHVLLQVNAIVAEAMQGKPSSLPQLKKMLEAQRVEVREVANQKTGKKQGVVFILHRQDAREPTVALAESGIPSDSRLTFGAIRTLSSMVMPPKSSFHLLLHCGD